MLGARCSYGLQERRFSTPRVILEVLLRAIPSILHPGDCHPAQGGPFKGSLDVASSRELCCAELGYTQLSFLPWAMHPFKLCPRCGGRVLQECTSPGLSRR